MARRPETFAFVSSDTPDARVAKRISYLVGADGKVIKAYDDVDPNVHAAQVVVDSRTTK